MITSDLLWRNSFEYILMEYLDILDVVFNQHTFE